MQVQIVGDINVLPDNDENYIIMLGGVIESVDELSSLEIKKLPNSYNFRIAPSLPKYSNLLLEEILKLNNLFHIHLEISKSIKTSGGTISFDIPIE